MDRSLDWNSQGSYQEACSQNNPAMSALKDKHLCIIEWPDSGQPELVMLKHKLNVMTGVCKRVRDSDWCFAIDGRQLLLCPFMGDPHGIVDKMLVHVYIQKLCKNLSECWPISWQNNMLIHQLATRSVLHTKIVQHMQRMLMNNDRPVAVQPVGLTRSHAERD